MIIIWRRQFKIFGGNAKAGIYNKRESEDDNMVGI